MYFPFKEIFVSALEAIFPNKSKVDNSKLFAIITIAYDMLYSTFSPHLEVFEFYKAQNKFLNVTFTKYKVTQGQRDFYSFIEVKKGSLFNLNSEEIGVADSLEINKGVYEAVMSIFTYIQEFIRKSEIDQRIKVFFL